MKNVFNLDASILFLGCHLDDIEFGCGGIIKDLTGSNYKNLNVATLSVSNKNSLGEIQLVRDIDESYRAMNLLGVKKNQVYIGSCYGQIFDQSQQQLREELIRLRQKYKPQVVFFPAKNDCHQDHAELSKNSFRIFRESNCFGYEIIRSTFAFDPNVYIEISESALNAKVEAIQCYQSQKEQSAGYYFKDDLVRSIAMFRGGQYNKKYAEAFEGYHICF